jgi:hypothetical protein
MSVFLIMMANANGLPISPFQGFKFHHTIVHRCSKGHDLGCIYARHTDVLQMSLFHPPYPVTRALGN